MYDKIVIGIDQSYKNTGISICADGKLLKVKSVNLERYKTNTMRRRVLAANLDKVLKAVVDKGAEIVCIIEQVRLFSRGFVNINYIKSIGALNAYIVDKCSEYDVPVYSIDTRCWKSQVVGTCKKVENDYGVPVEKWLTIQWVINEGFEEDILIKVEGKKKKGTFIRNDIKYQYNDDAADSAAIAMFGFVGDLTRLEEEH